MAPDVGRAPGAGPLSGSHLTDAGLLRRHAASLVSDALVIFPVRHHSPACAWQLRQLLARIRPASILIEGPASFTSLIPLLAHPAARMPLAVYTYAVFAATTTRPEQRHAAYYPFCDYSPELVALRHGHAHAIPTRFIDLDLADTAAETSPPDRTDNVSLLDEQHFSHSRRLQILASRLGCRDQEALWEHWFEVPASRLPLDEHIARLVTYCELARADHTAADLAADGTLPREAAMAWQIRQALDNRTPGDGPVVAIVGGFHALALQRAAAHAVAPPQPRANASEHASSLIRYSDERLDRLNGYASGMTSPAWHQANWERLLRLERTSLATATRARRDATLAMLSDIAQQLRDRHAIAIALPTLATAYQHCLGLARLRGRTAPIRDDLVDAVTSCFVKGEMSVEGATVTAVTRRILGGSTIGVVPPGAPVPPLVTDVLQRLRRQRMKIDDAARHRACLDIYRRADHRETSRLLHCLDFLEIPFAIRTGGPDFVLGHSLERLQEHWQYTFTPATESSLVEVSSLGATLSVAAESQFTRRLSAGDGQGQMSSAATAARLLTQSCVLGLHDHVPAVAQRLQAAISADLDFRSVTDAANAMQVLALAREPLQARRLDFLPGLLRSAYERALFLGQELPGAAAELHRQVEALARWREILAGHLGRQLDAALYWALLARLESGHPAAMIRGGATGLRYSGGHLDATDMARQIEGHLHGGIPSADAVAFVRGLLSTAREAAWQKEEFVRALDAAMAHWDESTFIDALPELRLAFATMTPRETDRVAGAVVQWTGNAPLGILYERQVTESQRDAHMRVSRALRDILAADGLSEWGGA
ncbi:DUF5682 family protein [Tahibacter amnicola]|uniref:DUF5682 family protein n=1 Tax=Tahibacter amnicola TaxID=2976241 RepID=A0ABY6BA89_9GAMM|nr:DUF5682 family protein [Tahibacter amnicola]UXI66978.1 DUF5682 family protein [Tahibacter amnicola]